MCVRAQSFAFLNGVMGRFKSNVDFGACQIKVASREHATHLSFSLPKKFESAS
jgi:hypothetical protein